MYTLWQDIRFGFRMMLRTPGLTVIAILTLAFGIGANTAIFSIVKGVVLRPLPFEEPGQLYNIWTDLPGFGREAASLPDYQDWRDQNSVFAQMAAYRDGAANLTGGSEPERINTLATTPNLFSMLRLKPAAGRLLADSDDNPSSSHVVVLSYKFWERKFGGSQDAIGKTVTLNTNSYLIVGVAPAEFALFSDTDVVTPTMLTPQQLAKLGRRSDFLHVVGRARPGVTEAQIAAQMNTVANRLSQQYPQTNKGVGVQVTNLQRDLLGNMRPLLLSLWAAVGFMLLIVCVNMANLMLAKGVARQREMAIRAALGARSGRLLQQLLTEGITLAVIGAVFGLLVAYWGTAALLAVAPKDMPFVSRVQLDSSVLAFAAGLSLLTGILFSLIPSFQGSKVDLNTGLKESSRTASSVRHSMRQVLVVSEIALSLVLLAGAGLMIRTLHQLYKASTGFNPDHLLTFRVAVPPGRYNDQQQTAFFNQLLLDLRSKPGVKSAGATTDLYVNDGASYLTFNLRGAPPMPPGEGIDAQVRSITPAYLDTIGVRLLRGRNISDEDRADRAKVAVINQALVDRYFAGQDLLGRSITLNGTDWYDIVGIIANVKQRGVEKEVYPEINLAQAQSPDSAMSVVLRTEGDPLSLVSTARASVSALDSTIPVYSVQTMDSILAETRAPQRFQAGLLASFASLALLLAAVGIYGVMAQSVAHRTPEFGIRMALGAPPAEVLRLVLGNGMRLSVIGLSIGIFGALVLSRFLKAFLFGVSSYDPFTMFAVSIALGSVAMLASFIPARRAMRIDPMHALRNE